MVAKGYNYEVVMYQADLLRLYNLCMKYGSVKTANKIKRMIFIRDYNENTMTDFDCQPTKAQMEIHDMSYKDYNDYVRAQRDFDNKMRDYYGDD